MKSRCQVEAKHGAHRREIRERDAVEAPTLKSGIALVRPVELTRNAAQTQVGYDARLTELRKQACS
jgi:hypothetical protein